MIKIEIESSAIKTIEGISAKTGKPYSMRIQSGYIFLIGTDGTVGKYPEKFDFLLAKDLHPYAPGLYMLHPSSLSLDRDGKLAVSIRLSASK